MGAVICLSVCLLTARMLSPNSSSALHAPRCCSPTRHSPIRPPPPASICTRPGLCRQEPLTPSLNSCAMYVTKPTSKRSRPYQHPWS
ncbi:hypothetical protein BKA80DRAFT_270748 [Phyllosticta citrichinensis]